ncbi:MAG TPA: ABC transporter permease subunit [Vicinamibacterales bacterium]
MSRWRAALLAGTALVVLAGPALAPYDPARGFDGYPYAPPMRPHLVDDDGRWHRPFAYPVRVVDPLERRYAEDRSRRIGFAAADPWFLLGADGFGRDVLSRLLAGARLSLGVAALAGALALLLGAALGSAAAYAGGWVDAALMRAADFTLVLPAIYVVLALRGVLPLVLGTREVFTVLSGVLALIGWPAIARGVRGILVVEGRAEYAEAARALGATPARVIWRHLLPATRSFLGVQLAILVPAFVMAEATLSFAGFGFAPPAPSWGAMLRDAAHVGVAVDAPWLLAPGAALLLTVFVIHAMAGDEVSSGPGF